MWGANLLCWFWNHFWKSHWTTDTGRSLVFWLTYSTCLGSGRHIKATGFLLFSRRCLVWNCSASSIWAEISQRSQSVNRQPRRSGDFKECFICLLSHRGLGFLSGHVDKAASWQYMLYQFNRPSIYGSPVAITWSFFSSVTKRREPINQKWSSPRKLNSPNNSWIFQVISYVRLNKIERPKCIKDAGAPKLLPLQCWFLLYTD